MSYELEKEIADLNEEIENRADDEVYTLAEIMRLRDRLLNGESVYSVISDMNLLIGYHAAYVRTAAASKLHEMEGV